MSIDILKFFYIKIEEYFWDLVSLVLVGLLISPIIHFFYFNFIYKLSYDIFPLSFGIAKIALWIIVFLLIRWFQVWLITKIVTHWPSRYAFNCMNKQKGLAKKRSNPLDNNKLLKEFIFQGNIRANKGGLLITNSHSGCLIRPVPNWLYFFNIKMGRTWKNLNANLEIAFVSQKFKMNKHDYLDAQTGKYKKTESEEFKDYLGLIFRAQSFDDYFMLELCKIGRNLSIRPHIRINAEWDAPILNTDFNTIRNIFSKYKNNIKLNLQVEDNIVTIMVKRKVLQWIIPTHVEVNLIRPGQTDKTSKTHIGEIYFREKAGMFGFRNYGNEIAFVKSLYIRGLG